jgi:hypothetical protein
MSVSASLQKARSALSPAAVPATVRAPLFHDIVVGLDDDRRHVVLDLGAASTEMLAILSQARCRVEIADFAHFGGIEMLNNAEPGSSLVDAADSWIQEQPKDDLIDLVLCWDLPNYLTLDALSALMNAIGRRARPDAIAHALIFYAEREMPEHPGRFIPSAGGELMDHRMPSTAVSAPRYSPEDLRLNMGPFKIDCGRLLRSGMQEYQFRLASTLGEKT